MSPSNIDKVLTWPELLEALPNATEAKCQKMIDAELAGLGRASYLQRAYIRMSALRHERELAALLKKAKTNSRGRRKQQ